MPENGVSGGTNWGMERTGSSASRGGAVPSDVVDGADGRKKLRVDTSQTYL